MIGREELALHLKDVWANDPLGFDAVADAVLGFAADQYRSGFLAGRDAAADKAADFACPECGGRGSRANPDAELERHDCVECRASGSLHDLDDVIRGIRLLAPPAAPAEETKR